MLKTEEFAEIDPPVDRRLRHPVRDEIVETILVQLLLQFLVETVEDLILDAMDVFVHDAGSERMIYTDEDQSCLHDCFMTDGCHRTSEAIADICENW